jgi:hypothetical protein
MRLQVRSSAVTLSWRFSPALDTNGNTVQFLKHSGQNKRGRFNIEPLKALLGDFHRVS